MLFTCCFLFLHVKISKSPASSSVFPVIGTCHIIFNHPVNITFHSIASRLMFAPKLLRALLDLSLRDAQQSSPLARGQLSLLGKISEYSKIWWLWIERSVSCPLHLSIKRSKMKSCFFKTFLGMASLIGLLCWALWLGHWEHLVIESWAEGATLVSFWWLDAAGERKELFSYRNVGHIPTLSPESPSEGENVCFPNP